MSADTTPPNHAIGVTEAVHAPGSSKIQRFDIWVQDHSLLLFWIFLTGLTLTTGLLLLWKGIQVITLAQQFAPVLTVVSFVLGGGITTLRWFRMRRRTRLGTAAQGELTSERP